MTEKEKLCLKCMACCKITVAPLVFPSDSKGAEAFYRARGYETGERRGQLCLILQIPCAQLTAFGCKMYNDRPKWCRQYDGRTDPFIDCLWEELDTKM